MSQAIRSGDSVYKLPQTTSIALISLGSNQESLVGDPRATLMFAIRKLIDGPFPIRKQSQFYETAAMPPGSGPDYLNACVAVDALGSSKALLEHLHSIEAQAGRIREQRWSARTLDLDLIAFGDEIAPDLETFRHWANLPFENQKVEAPTELILPHPRAHQRGFVLYPLLEICPDWRHPVFSKTVREMCAELPEDQRLENTAQTPIL